MDTKKSLNAFFSGTMIVVVGTVIGLGFEFLSRVLLIRNYSTAEYGTFALGYAVFSLIVLISTLGFQEGLSRQAAYLIGQRKRPEAHNASWNALWLVALWSVILAGLGYASSELLAAAFRNPESVLVFRAFFLAAPFFAVVFVISAAFRGVGNVSAKVLLQDFLINGGKLAAIALLILAGASFSGVITGYASVYLLAAVVAFVFFARFFSRGSRSSKRELLLVSLPLLGVNLFYVGLAWSDVIILGLLKSSSEVGLYSGVADLARFLRVAVLSSVFVYTPIAAHLVGRGNLRELKVVYVAVTKWIMVASVPAGVLIMIFPRTILEFLYGSEYAEAAATLTVMTLGFLISMSFGLAGSTLVALGRSSQTLAAFVSGFIVNVILNLWLIPPYGITGAAIASGISFSVVAVILTVLVLKGINVHAFTRRHVSIVLIGASLGAVLYFVTKAFPGRDSSLLIVIFASGVYCALYVVLLVLARTFDDNDLVVLDSIEHTLKVNLSAVKRIIKRFNK